jgi:hypothetical protein
MKNMGGMPPMPPSMGGMNPLGGGSPNPFGGESIGAAATLSNEDRVTEAKRRREARKARKKSRKKN